MTTRPLVIQTEDLDKECVDWLSERCEVLRCFHTEPKFPELLARAEGLVVRTYTRVDESLLRGAPKLKVVGRAGVALENVDVGACLAHGVQVCNTPGSNTRAVVEYFTALLMDAVRPRVFLEGPMEGEAWHQARRDLVADRELNEMTIGIWGFGRIGSAVARVARALDSWNAFTVLRWLTRRRGGAATRSSTVMPRQRSHEAPQGSMFSSK